MTTKTKITTIVVLLVGSLALPATADPATNRAGAWLDWLGEIWTNLTSFQQAGDEGHPIVEPVGSRSITNPGDELGPMGEPIGNPAVADRSCDEMGPYIDPFGCEGIRGSAAPTDAQDEVGGYIEPTG